MFVSVQSLTSYMDKNIKYVNEAIENKTSFDNDMFSAYIEKMRNKLNRQVNSLKQISSNNKLIAKYEKKVNDLFAQ